MRVISGKYRGKPLCSFEGKDIRPTIDRIKESIFNVIQFDVKDCQFLDLFAGSGAIGIEAISRGADVVFNDLKTSSLNILKKNLSFIKEPYVVLNKDYKDALVAAKRKFDFIFVDAPYKMDCIEDILRIVKNKDILHENGYIIYEHEKEKQYETDAYFYVEKKKVFGNIVVDFIKLAKKICVATGSFDPITNGHISIINKAKEQFDKIVVLIAQNEEKDSFYNFKQRLDLVKTAFKEDEKIFVDVCDGFVYKYLNDKKLDIIVRGYRTNQDLEYEQKMSKFNLEHGGVNTLLYKAEDNIQNLSSTSVRKIIKNGRDLKGLVPNNIIKKIKKYEEVKKNDSTKC